MLALFLGIGAFWLLTQEWEAPLQLEIVSGLRGGVLKGPELKITYGLFITQCVIIGVGYALQGGDGKQWYVRATHVLVYMGAALGVIPACLWLAVFASKGLPEYHLVLLPIIPVAFGMTMAYFLYEIQRGKDLIEDLVKQRYKLEDV